MEREGKENVAWRRCAKSRIVGERDIKIRVDAKSETHLVNCKVASLASFSYRGRRFFPRPVLRLRPHPCCYNYYSSYLGRFALYLNLNTPSQPSCRRLLLPTCRLSVPPLLALFLVLARSRRGPARHPLPRNSPP